MIVDCNTLVSLSKNCLVEQLDGPRDRHVDHKKSGGRPTPKVGGTDPWLGAGVQWKRKGKASRRGFFFSPSLGLPSSLSPVGVCGQLLQACSATWLLTTDSH